MEGYGVIRPSEIAAPQDGATDCFLNSPAISASDLQTSSPL
jgi:cold shock CspA family protein